MFGGATLTTALSDTFVLAYICLLITGVYAIGCWLTSDKLADKVRNAPVLYDGRGSRIGMQAGAGLLWLILPSFSLLVVFILVGLWIRHSQIDKELEQLAG